MKVTSILKVALKKYLLVGLVVIVPFVVTFQVVLFVIRYLDQILSVKNGTFLYFIPENFHPTALLGFHIPGLGFIFTIILLLLVGMFSTNFIGRKLLQGVSGLIGRIPGMGAIYKSVKQIIDTYASRDESPFSRVILIEYPRKGLHTLAFVTSTTKGKLGENTPEDCLNIFVPTTPNPTSGFFMVIPEKDTKTLDVSIEDAFKIIISGGVVSPDSEKAAS